MKQVYLWGGAIVIILLALFGLSHLTAQNTAQQANISDQYATTTTNINATTSTTISTTTMETQQASSSLAQTTDVIMHTNKGDITLELFTDKAPITAGNFIKLAKEKFYDGTKFHRVIANFMIQGGDPLTKDDAQMERWGTGGPGYAIQDEFAPGLSNVRGTIAMANAGPGTGGSQFFINVVDNTFLDGKHPVFGKVIKGMEVVDAIKEVKTGVNDRPVTAVTITSVAVQ